jgi:hypothetical protein
VDLLTAEGAGAFVGTWRLISLEARLEDGEVIRARRRRSGYLMYGDDGYMSVAFMADGRPKFSSPDIRGGTPEEKVTAINDYISYCGRFEVKEDRVVHHIEVSLFPNWVGTSQERSYEFDGDRLTLSTPLMTVGGRRLSNRLVWQKVSCS